MTNTIPSQHAISLVCTVRDEADNIAALLDSMFRQSLPATEIVVNDCGSRDATAAIVQSYIDAGHPIRLVSGGHNIPSGRNNAIRHAKYPIVACTDAGLTLDPRWLEEITAPLRQGEADIVGGFFRATPQSRFELALGATNYREVEEIKPEGFLPFGKSVAFRKQVWELVGGYPEWASHCEDLIFALALKRQQIRFAFAPKAIVHFRPRSSLVAFARQYYFYARGDGVANLWPRRHLIRYVTYLMLALMLRLAPRWPWLLALIGLGGYGYVHAPLRRLAKRAPTLTPLEWLATAAYIPLIRVTGDLAKMVGYPVGILRRVRSAELRQAIADYTQRSATDDKAT